MDPATRLLLSKFYFEHNRRLEQLVHRDLSHWDRKSAG
jgi:hypothetical protein